MTDTPVPDDPFPASVARTEGPPSRYRAPDAVWAQVREDYLAGVSAPACCRRHGVGLSALRDRAAREGWRRADQLAGSRGGLDPDDEGVALEESVDGDLDRIGLNELAYVAVRRMMRAVLRGDAAEALRWRRVREAVDAEDEHFSRLVALALRDGLIPAGRFDSDASDVSDASDGVSDRPIPPSADAG